MLSIAFAAFIVQIQAPPSDARQLTLSTPTAIADIDTSKLKGDLARLAWSPDGSEFYIQTIGRDGRGNVKSQKHYLVSAAGAGIRGVDVEPTWASKYWMWKSAQASPSAPAFKIAVDSHQETVRATSAPTGGALAKGGLTDPLQGTTVADVADAAQQTQIKNIYALKLKGETIGEWINEPVLPGVNFGWAPSPLRLIAFTRREGGPLMLLDESGHKQDLSGAKSAVLPAWSDDGRRIAWLERRDKKKYQLMVAEVAPR